MIGTESNSIDASLQKAIRVIKKAQSKGIDKSEVIEFLKQHGLSDADINTAFESYQSRSDAESEQAANDADIFADPSLDAIPGKNGVQDGKARAQQLLKSYLAENSGKLPEDATVLEQYALDQSSDPVNHNDAVYALETYKASHPTNSVALKMPDDTDIFNTELKHDPFDDIEFDDPGLTQEGQAGEASKNEPLDTEEAGEHSDSFYEYEVAGAPWWMPVDESIVYKSNREVIESPPNGQSNGNGNSNNTSVDAISKARAQTIIDPTSEDVQYMDSVQVVVANSYLKEQAQGKQDKRGYILSIDLQVQCRKYLLFTSLLLFIVVITFASSIYTGFYQWRGYLFNIMVTLVLAYGVFVGFVCAEMNRYKTRFLLILLNVYWTITWIAFIGLALTAGVYLVLFPRKFKNYCKTRAVCESTLEYIVFAEMTLICALIVYVTMMLYYMGCIAKLVILISNLREYKLKYESNKFMRKCHKHVYRYLRGWKSFRSIITRATGIKLVDVLYCSCWFRKCARKSASTWKPASEQEKKREKERKKKKQKKQKTRSNWESDLYFHDTTVYNYHTANPPSHSAGCCSDAQDGTCCNCDCNDIWDGCGQCLREMWICNRINCSGTDSGCCKTYHTDSVGDCGGACKACGDICGCCGCRDCGGGCDCGDCDGEGAVALFGLVCVVIIAIVIFLLPVIMFVCIAAPFWLFAQYMSWKLNDKAPWALVVLVFIISMIPPCVIWAYIWSAICLGNMNNTFMTIICLIWSFFHAVYNSVA